MRSVNRAFSEKKPPYAVEAALLLSEIQQQLHMPQITSLRIVNRYDFTCDSINDTEKTAVLNKLRTQIFSDPALDEATDFLPLRENEFHFTAEYIPGQYDQRADFAEQSMIMLGLSNPRVITAKAYLFAANGNISENDLSRLKKFIINPLERRLASELLPESIDFNDTPAAPIKTLPIISLNDSELSNLHKEMGLAMNLADFAFVRDYFAGEKREPTVTEIRVIDTYWSDHCRHTTFHTIIQNAEIEDGPYSGVIREAFAKYLENEQGKERPLSLMNIALSAMRRQRAEGTLNDLEESDEVNAASIVVDAVVNGKPEQWIVMFKNETHNHPTEIEPMGGAGTCLGGAIRDPLSGRAYVYGAIRVTGSADPTVPLDKTYPGKLPQRVITNVAAQGYSGYGNQIGVAAGHIREIYHPGFIAKRMELGFVIAASPKENIKRGKPQPGDVIFLLGGNTGRDGIGGATGSSREQAADALTSAGAEVQKGNPAIERKILRLFRRKEAAQLIKMCNDFGAGGVSVAIGELADSLMIELDKVPVKYPGLDGTELAISESQERMAVVISADDAQTFLNYAAEEGLQAVIVATVTDDGHMRMNWRGTQIVDIKRDFLKTNGVRAYTEVFVKSPGDKPDFAADNVKSDNNAELWTNNLKRLNVSGQRGLIQRFDSTAGSNTVLLPLGGKTQRTPSLGLAMTLPAFGSPSENDTVTLTAYGYNPFAGEWSPFHGALYAVVESITKVVAMGADYSKLRLTFQEYFERLGNDSQKWGKPFAALLGAFHAQTQLGLPSIGGKDSMSGSFGELHVPPTLVSFAVGTAALKNITSPEFKEAGNAVILLRAPMNKEHVPDFCALKKNYEAVNRLIKSGDILSASNVGIGGVAAELSKMAFGNRVGCAVDWIEDFDYFSDDPTALILEIKIGNKSEERPKDEFYNSLMRLAYGGKSETVPYGNSAEYIKLGTTIEEPSIILRQENIEKKLPLDDLLQAWESTLEDVFPTKTPQTAPCLPRLKQTSKPRVLIPVFPGTNCEYEMADAFERQGASVECFVCDYSENAKALAKKIRETQILAFAGGSAAGDEPDGAAKLTALLLRKDYVYDALLELINSRDGLILGICNGFQALIRMGFFGSGLAMAQNPIGRTASQMVRVKTVCNRSPWFAFNAVGDIEYLPISKSEGRLICGEALYAELKGKRQIASVYADENGQPSMDIEYNPSASAYAIEALTSADGRILGRMAHSEREGIYKNFTRSANDGIFRAGVYYFI